MNKDNNLRNLKVKVTLIKLWIGNNLSYNQTRKSKAKM